MADNIIGPLQGLREQDQVKGLDTSYQFRPVSETAAVEHVQKSDSIQFSEEAKEMGPDVKNQNFDTLKSSFADIRSQVTTPPSGNDASELLKKDVSKVGEARTNMQGMAIGEKLGPNPGVTNGGTFSSRGGSRGIEAGASAGEVFSSRRVSPLAYEPGGGRATPDMVKLQTDYAQTIKQNDTVTPAVNDQVIKSFADSGKSDKPIKALLGMQS